jgi:hypothetical protein
MKWLSRHFTRTLPVIMLGLASLPASAWTVDGTRSCGAIRSQESPVLCSDGGGGTFIAWTDLRGGATSDVYIQHLTASGVIYPGWPADGVPVFTLANSQFIAAIAPDGVGGILVAGEDFSHGPYDLLVQRLTASGAVSPGWPAQGAVVDSTPNYSDVVSMDSDGSGGVFIGWEDQNIEATVYHGFAQHLTGAGLVAPGWPAGGRGLSPTAPYSSSVRVRADGAGGALIAWTQMPSSVISSWLMIQHFLGDGSIAAGWPLDGAILCAPPLGRAVSGIAPDGLGGWFAVWDDNRIASSDTYLDIYGQHCLATGQIDPGWPADGLLLCAAPNMQADSKLCEDGVGGFFATWEDSRSNTAKLYGTHVNAAGQRPPGWPVDGLALSAQSFYQLDPRMAPDGSGGFYVQWLNYNGNYRGCILHLTGNGLPALGWSTNGLEVTSTLGDQQSANMIIDGAGGAFVTWEDNRTDDGDIYAQRYLADGPVPTLASLISTEISSTAVRLLWQAVGFQGTAHVYRRDATHDWAMLGATTRTGEDDFSFEDRSIIAGSRYSCRLGFGEGASETFSAENWVEVPTGFALGLQGLSPNPATHPLRIRFSLPNAASAQLEVLDVAGRRVFEREVGSLGAGNHVVGIDSDRPIASGMYWIRLTGQSKTLVARGVVIN